MTSGKSVKRKSAKSAKTKAKKAEATRATAKTATRAKSYKPKTARRAGSSKPKTSSEIFVAPSLLLGAHVSIAGGTAEAPARAKAIGATAMQIFTKMANRWAERACEDEECRAFRNALSSTDVRITVAHDSYLINLASPDPLLRRRSIESFVLELARCEALAVDYLVSHPGNFMDQRESGIRRNAESIAEALERVPGRTVLCLETTCGSGTAIGATFEELAAVIDAVPTAHRARVGVCVDTCHVYSAGLDLVKDYDGVWGRFEDVLGWPRLRVMHLNDSKTPFGSRRDRHELIAEGSLGEGPFRRIMCDDRLANVPKLIETPKLDDASTTDARMLARLRSYASVGRAGTRSDSTDNQPGP